MRDQNYITMMDPFQRKYGKTLTAFLAIVPFVSELMWVPVTLISLGVTVSVFSDLPLSLCIWISAAVAIAYTVLGGLFSVAFTDVVRLSLVFCSLSIGNLAFQDFHQRTLSSSSTSTARITCFIAAGVVLVLGIPPVLIGAVAASTDWNLTSYGSPSPYERGEAAMVLPIILLHLTPTAIFIVGMGAIAGAAVSSTDSCLLAATSIFTTNIYKIIRHQASDKELQWVIRFSILAVGIVGTCLTYLDSSILAFWILSSDLTYTIMLPQLIYILFVKVSNGYGAAAGYLVAFVMRVLCGEPMFNLPVILKFPGCTLEDGVYIQRSPVKTICMLSSLISLLMFSYVASLLFNKGIRPERWDVFKVKSQETPADGAREGDGENADAGNENELMLQTEC